MKIIGITGPIGSGKSYVAEMMSKRGYPKIDTDKVYHNLISKGSKCTLALRGEFGDEIISANGSVNREVLRNIVFSDEKKLRRLNEITHKFVTDEVDYLLREHSEKGVKAVLVEVPMMFESGFDKKCDTVICVVANESVRVSRLCERNDISEEEAKFRIKKQKDVEFYIANSNYIVYNNVNEDLDGQIDRLFEKIFEKKRI